MASVDYSGRMTSVIYKEVYPIVAEKLKTREPKFKANINEFMNKNHDALYALAPYDNIYFTQTDIDKLFASLDLSEKEIAKIMEGCFWYKEPINPQCVKEPYVEVLICALIYFLKNKKQREAEVTLIFLCFSGKFYASLYGKQFNKLPPNKAKSVMDYVVNTMINDKFNIKQEGSVFGAIRKICIKLIDTYSKMITNNPDDDDIKYFIQQARSRVSDFLIHIAHKYFEAYTNRNYLNFESDNLVDGTEFRITDSDATIAAKITQNCVNYMLSNTVDFKICNEIADVIIRPTELKALMESIITNKENRSELYRICNIMICDFMRRYPKKRVGSVEFISYWFTQKPNTKDKYILELQSIVVNWLMQDANYRRRKSRSATDIAYRKAVVNYITLVIDKVARKF